MHLENSGEQCLSLSDLSASEQAALLYMRNCLPARAVLAKLRESTVRLSHRDFRALLERGLARRGIGGRHVLTARGYNVSSEVLRDLILRLNIVLQAPALPRGCYQRQWHTSQSTW